MTQYAIVAFPDADALGIIESVRQRYDPQVRLIAAHVTLVFAFQTPVSLGALRAHVARVAAGTSPFRVQFAGVRIGDREYLYLDIDEGREQVIALHQQLYTGPLAGVMSAERLYEPHVTIGRIADIRVLDDARLHAAAVVPVSNALIDALSIFRLDTPDKGTVDASVPLAAVS